MTRWWVLALLLMTAARGAETRQQPSEEFLAKPFDEQQVAVYDAFWEALDKHYYDTDVLATPEFRQLRAEGRRRAALDLLDDALYLRIFAGIAAKLPESHVSAEPPQPPPPAEPHGPAPNPTAREVRLNSMLDLGPGFIGAQVRRGMSRYGLVDEVRPDTPAAEAGIQPGWRIMKAVSSLVVADNKVRFLGEFIPLDADAAAAWESGAVQPAEIDRFRIVRITFDHRPMATRAPIDVRRLPGGAQFLRFDAFGSDEDMAPVVHAIETAGSAGLVIDLRANGGGLTEQLQKIAGMLLEDDVVLGRLHNSKGAINLHVATPARRYRGPLVVLVGPSSGSCAEILAAAMQEYKRGLVVGRMTNGSALVSQAFPLPDGGIARVPITDFRTSRDKRIEGVGVTPDVRVVPTLEDVIEGHDTALERAIALLKR